MTHNPSIARTEIVFVFDNLPDWQQLAAGVRAGAQVVVLSGARDGLAQIAAHLQGRAGVDAIHVLSHGQPGSLQLGSLTLDQAALAGRADTLAQIGGALSDSGDILLYGCDTASGEAGAVFISQWARLTQADVAASTNRTGSAHLSGDWVLEATVGPVENGLGLSAAAADAYAHVLAAPSDQGFDSETPGLLAPGTEATGEVIGGIVYSLQSPAPVDPQDGAAMYGGISLTSTDSTFTITPNNNDLAVIFNYGANTVAVPGSLDARIKSADGTEFRIVSMEIDTGAFADPSDSNLTITSNPNLTIKGYRDGVEVATDAFNTGNATSGSGGTAVLYTKNGVTFGFGGTLTFGSDWNYIDEIRITGTAPGGTIVAIDDLDFEPGIPPDSTPPTVSSVTSSALNGTYKVGSPISIQVNFSENVIVAGGTPQLTLETGTTDRTINYTGGTGSSTLTFTYTVQAGDTTADLDYWATNALALNGSTIRDAAGNNAVLTLASPGAANSLGNNKAIVIDGVVPTVTSVNASTANGTYKVGDTVSILVNFSEAVTVTGTPQLTLETGGTDRTVNYASGTGTSTLTFTYTVQAGDNSMDLDYASTSALALGGGTIRDAAGNDATLTLPSPGANNSLGANTDLVVDGVAPAVSGNIAVPVAGAYSVGQTLSFTVTFDDNVVVTGTDSTLGLTIGSTARNAAFESKTANSITYTYTVQAGETDADGISVGAIAPGSTTIRDVAGNNANASLLGKIPSLTGVLVDTSGPTIASVSVPANATYAEGQNLDFTVNFNEAVTVGGTPRIAITLDTGGTVYASYVSGTGGTALLFSATVAAGWEDADGIAISAALDLNGGTLRDGAGNNAVLTLNSVGAVTGVLVDTTAPGAPSTPDMAANSDSGVSNTDNLTNATTPTFTGTAEAGSTVRLYDTDGTTELGRTTADVGGIWSITSTALAEGPHTITAKATDAAGNQGLASAGLGFTIDTTAPTLTITSNVPTLKIGETATITFTFSEDPGASFVWDGSSGDVTVFGGTLGAISGSGLTRTALFTPTPDTNAGTASITVSAGAYADTAGNTGGAGNTPTLNFDTLAPTTTIASFVFSADSGASASDFVTNTAAQDLSGTLNANLAPGEIVEVSLDAGATWNTATASVGNASWSLAGQTLSASNTLQARVVDAAGNTGAVSSQLYTLDTTAPSPNPAGGTPADDATGVVVTNDIVLAFSEALDATDSVLTQVYLKDVATDTLVPATITINGSGALVINPTASLAPATAYYVTWEDTALTDIAGNFAAAVSDETTYNFTTQAAPVIPDPGIPTPPTPNPPTPGVPDNDGIPAIIEDQAPGIPGPGGTPPVPGDGNGDGIKDSEQASVASIGFVLSPTGESNPGSAPPTYTTLVASSQDGKVSGDPSNSRITSLSQKDAPADLPHGMETPIGLVSFTVELAQGKTGEKFSLYLDPALGINGYWKQDSTGTWINIASEPYGGKMVMEGGKLRLDFHIEDGGQFDADGKVDGIITDPGAPGHMPLSIVGQTPDMGHGFWF